MASQGKARRGYSGTFRLRPGPALHRHLAEQAEEQGMSLHQWTLELLAGGSNFQLPDETNSAPPPMFKWGTAAHIAQIAARLGTFEVWHLAHELQMSKDSARERLQEALASGVVKEVTPAAGPKAATYQYVGSSEG